MNIYLTGYRATGKTSIGKALAGKLGRRFIDADDHIEKTAQMPVSEIVAALGWDEFRRMEASAIAAITQMDNLVVATGGGVILNHKNMEKLRQTGIIVWLDASADTIIARMTKDPRTSTQRPSLLENGESQADEVAQTLAHRIPLYQQASHLRINTDKADVDTICNRIINVLKE